VQVSHTDDLYDKLDKTDQVFTPHMELTEPLLLAKLGDLIDPNTGKTYADAKAVKSVRISGTGVQITVELGYPAASQFASIAQQFEATAKTNGAETATVEVSSKIVAHTVQGNVALLPGVKNIVAVSSGKGGVGKSTTAVNLALALSQEGARVGLLDADIYGPSQPQMLGIAEQQPDSADGKTMLPLQAHGLQANSIGFLIDPEQPMVWRGPMVTQALRQLLFETQWDNLDYLIIDMPPGTGDIQLTLAQTVPVTGAVIVTTPQDIALLDARKGLKMFEKVGIPILGIVENMSIHVCSNCGHAEHIFGAGGGAAMCADYGVPFLGDLPLDIRIRTQTDAGTPTVVAEPTGTIAEAYRRIARKVAVSIAEKQRDMRLKFPTIVINKN